MDGFCIGLEIAEFKDSQLSIQILPSFFANVNIILNYSLRELKSCKAR